MSTLITAIRNNIPNALTCMNALCGSVAVIAAFHCFEPFAFGLQGYQVAYLCIVMAAVFDFFDGFVARWLHSVSNLGKELDSLSDAISFGLAPAMVLYNMLVTAYPGSLLPAIALLLPISGILRLARFNTATDQSTTFTGLAIPANALFWIGATNYFATHATNFLSSAGQLVVIAAVVAFAYLMISPLRMFSLKVKSWSLSGAYRQYLLIFSAIVCVALAGITGLSGAMLCYVILSLLPDRS